MSSAEAGLLIRNSKRKTTSINALPISWRTLAKLASRELRRHWGWATVCGLSLFVSSVAVIILLSITQTYRTTITLRSKELLGADYVITSRIKPSEEVFQYLRSIPGFESEQVQTNTMLSTPSGRFRISQVRGVDERYPLYGQIRTVPQGIQIAGTKNVVIDESLRRQLGLELGDHITLGRSEFLLAGTIEAVPGELSVFGFVAPRVFVSLSELKETGLLNFGSQARYRFLFRKVGPSAAGPSALASEVCPPWQTYLRHAVSGLRSFLALKCCDPNRLSFSCRSTSAPDTDLAFRAKLKSYQLEIESAEERASSTGRLSGAIEQMLKVVAILMLGLGALGYTTALQFDLQRRAKALKPLLLLGVREREVRGVLLVGTLFSNALVFVLVGVVSFVLLPLSLKVVGSLFPLEMQLDFNLAALLTIISFALALTVWNSFTVQLEGQAKIGIIPWILRTILPVAVAIISAATLLADHRLALEVLVGILVLALFAYIFTLLFAWILERGVNHVSAYLRFGVRLVTRRKYYHLLSVLAVSVSALCVLSSTLFKESIIAQLYALTAGERPNSFLFDVQPEQLDAVVQLGGKYSLKTLKPVPVITMRLAEIDGVDVATLSSDPKRVAWVLKREYRTTYRDSLQNSEKLVAGEFVPTVEPVDASSADTVVPISVEEKIASDLQIGLGSILTFDIQGVPIRGRVSNLRKVDWKSGDINFFITFPTGVLEKAPHYFALLSRFDNEHQFESFEKELSQLSPNVSVIDLREIFKGLEVLLGELAQIASTLSLSVLILGSVILITSILGTGESRERMERVLFIIGADRFFRAKVLIVESALLSALGIVFGFVGALLFSEVFLVQRMELPRPGIQGELLEQLILLFSIPFLTALVVSFISRPASGNKTLLTTCVATLISWACCKT